jgi:hypothetical protein
VLPAVAACVDRLLLLIRFPVALGKQSIELADNRVSRMGGGQASLECLNGRRKVAEFVVDRAEVEEGEEIARLLGTFEFEEPEVACKFAAPERGIDVTDMVNDGIGPPDLGAGPPQRRQAR